MNFFIVDALYPQTVAAFYARDKEREFWPYKRQLAEISRESGMCAAWWLVNELNRMPATTTSAVIANAERFQRCWAKEADFKINDDWFQEILAEQIRQAQPDVLVIFPVSLIHSGFVEQVRKSCPQLRCVVAWDGVGAYSEILIKEYDVILSCVAHVTEFYRSRGKPAATLATGFDTSLKDEMQGLELCYNTVFVGKLERSTIYAERFQLLLEISRKREIALWLSYYPDWHPWSRMQLGLLRRHQWQEFKENWELGRRNRGMRFGRDMFRTFGQARISLNQHGYSGGQNSGNRRIWEATGMGTCLLTDWHPNLHEIFKIDEEIVTYRSVEECIEKMDYLLAHEEKRKAIAEAGMKRTHRDYSTRQFAEALMRHVEDVVKA